MGEKAQRIPVAEASRAATRAARSARSGSHVAEMPRGMGNSVRKLLMMSYPKMTLMCRRDFSMAMR